MSSWSWTMPASRPSTTATFQRIWVSTWICNVNRPYMRLQLWTIGLYGQCPIRIYNACCLIGDSANDKEELPVILFLFGPRPIASVGMMVKISYGLPTNEASARLNDEVTKFQQASEALRSGLWFERRDSKMWYTLWLADHFLYSMTDSWALLITRHYRSSLPRTRQRFLHTWSSSQSVYLV